MMVLLLIARSCMHVRYFVCVLGSAEHLEARVLKSSPQTKAPGNTRRAKARETAGAGRWVWSESVPTENPRRFHYLEQGDLQEKLSSFNKM